MSRAVRTRPARSLTLVVAVGLLLTACGGDPGEVDWRGVTVDVPEDWTVFEEEDTRLSIANAELGQGDGDEPLAQPEGDVVAMFFRHEPGLRPDDWREYIDTLEDGVIESDDALELADEVPATRIVFSHVSLEVPTREMVVIIPAREIEILAQPVPQPGDTDAPDIFMDHISTFLEVVDTMRFGAPVE